MNYHTIPQLKEGDHIRILCTARSAEKSQLTPAKDLLESWGLRVSYGNTIGKIEHQLGGTKEERLTDLQESINNTDVDAVWIARGGYGTVQLIDAIDFSDFSKVKSTVIIGYSDVTLLHGKLQSQGYASLHSFMPLELSKKPVSSIESLRKALFGQSQTITIKNSFHLSSQVIKAPVTGGNLSILYSMLGSDTFPKTDGHILFIEDIDEYLYHIERMMYSLKRAGKLKNIKALLVGGMTDMNDHEIPFGKNAQEIILSLTESYEFPVIFNFPAGHIKDNRSLILGKEITISITPESINFNQ